MDWTDKLKQALESKGPLSQPEFEQQVDELTQEVASSFRVEYNTPESDQAAFEYVAKELAKLQEIEGETD